MPIPACAGRHGAVMAKNRIRADRQRPTPKPLPFVVYSADRGILLSGYQVNGPHEVALGERVRWPT